MITTPGQLMLRDALPAKYHEYLAKDLDEGTLRDVLTSMAKDDPDGYQDVVAKFMDVAKEAVTTYGSESSMGLKDLRLPPKLRTYRNIVKKELTNIKESSLPGAEKRKRVVDLMMKVMDDVPETLLKEAARDRSGLAAMVLSGSRGNKSQMAQILFGDILLVDAQDRPVPIPGVHGYAEGVTPMEYWAAANGARKGSVSAQFSTADSGYAAKQLGNVGHRLVVTEEDCGTGNGLLVDAGDPDNIGAVLMEDAKGVPKGTVLTKKALGKLGDEEIVVRSTTTCEAKNGVCSRCSGIRERGGFPELGEMVGNVATRAISEPMTQLALRAKHTGGVAGLDDKTVSGFEEVNQFMQVPANFIGGAALAELDGLVTRVDEAPGGGWNVFVADERHYVPGNRELKVKRGDRVTAGDALSDGVPNPADVVRHKGIGEGRRYFVKEFSDMLKRNGSGTHRRNVEALARGFMNRVEITDPDGFAGYYSGDVVPYDDLVRTYEPRRGAELSSLAKARGKYLEKPTLHYSIGTLVTPKVLETLKRRGIESVMTHPERPPFTPRAVKMRDILQTDPDWMTRMAGENLMRTTLETAAVGGTSRPKGTSYFPAVADMSRLRGALGLDD